MTESPLSYADAEQLTDYFHEYMPMDGQEVYSVTTKTIERNDTSALIFIVQTGLIYSAIILFVICFTILSLQQLSDSGKYRYRFQVLRNMGVEENHIRRLVLKQLGIWFGVPVMVALLISSAFILFLFIGFSIQIRTYIGAWKLFAASRNYFDYFVCFIDLLFHQHLDIIPKVHFTRTGGEM